MSDAILFTGAHRLVTRSVPLPALGPRDLLIRTNLTAISPTHAWPRLTGGFAHLPGMTFPLIPGDAAVGTVVAVGAAVDAAWHGASVFVGAARTPDGINAAGGVQQRWLVTPVGAAVRVEGWEPERALFLAPVCLALHNLARVGAAGARLAILGQGVLGQMVARIARSCRAAHIVVADVSARRLAHAIADRTVQISPISPVAPTKGAQDIDLLVDTTGDAALVHAWSARLRPDGTLLLLGHYARLDLAYLQEPPGGRGIILASEPGGGAYAAARDMLSGEDCDTTGLVSHRFTPDHMAQAYAVALGDPDALQMIVAWQ
jgi:3-hydroxyethyl bacteriochlorophyllide a dehydrogenase